MIIDKDVLPELLTDETRGVLAGVFYDKEAHALRATDGKALIAVPVRDDENDDQGLIPVAALKEARKAARGRTALPMTLEVKAGRVTAPFANGQSWPLLPTNPAPQMPYPDFSIALPKFTAGETRTARLTIDPFLLLALWKAAGFSDVKQGKRAACVLEFALDAEDDAVSKPIKVTPLSPGGQTLAFMPMKTISRAPNRIDDVEKAHNVAIVERKARDAGQDANAIDAAVIGAMAL